LESAIANLAINARDAMPEGGTITIETANKILDAAYAAQNADVTPGDYAMIAVTDTGSGIPAAVLARVFEPFFTTKEVGKGSGLGLSMVYGFVKQSGGHVKIYSEEGRGTTVRLYLPKAEAAHETRKASAQNEMAMPKGKETILIVEDDPMVRDMAVKGLRDLGYSVLEAENGMRALHILQNGKPVDLLFTDVVMPGGLSGADLAKRVAELRPELKVLFTSGFAEASFQNGSRPESLAPMLSKPYRYNELARMVRNVLNG
jgi:CheY-like chemotaxis protein